MLSEPHWSLLYVMAVSHRASEFHWSRFYITCLGAIVRVRGPLVPAILCIFDGYGVPLVRDIYIHFSLLSIMKGLVVLWLHVRPIVTYKQVVLPKRSDIYMYVPVYVYISHYDVDVLLSNN